MNLLSLAPEFHALIEKTGRSSARSYMFYVEIDIFEGISLRLATYDIPNWPSWTNLGPFKTEEEAYIATKAKIEKAKKDIELYQTNLQKGYPCANLDSDSVE